MVPRVPLADLELVAAYAIFLASYLVFAIGKFPGMKIDRPGAAIIGAVLMVACRIIVPLDALHFVDFSTIVLLFSMMLIVAYLHLAGFFDWITHLVVTRLKPHHLLPTVIWTSGVLSAFFVNDIICLVMVPFVLTATRRMGVKPLPYLLAVATASNIGSVATITGNPQNMLIGSFSGISYREFLWHLGPIALGGLLLDWLLIYLLLVRFGAHDPSVDLIPKEPPTTDHTRLVKPGLVILLVIAGFFAGAPPALMAAFGAAIMLITRTRDPHLVYEEVDWGLLVFFVGSSSSSVAPRRPASPTTCSASPTTGTCTTPRASRWWWRCFPTSSATCPPSCCSNPSFPALRIRTPAGWSWPWPAPSPAI